MQLERATSRSGQASLAGWISSNDVTLFTTVLVLAIAIFLHARLSTAEKEKAQVSQEKTALADRLDTTAGELGASKGLLDETRKTLDLTQSERDQLRQQLVDKLDAIARLNTNLDALMKEKGRLDSQQQSLSAAQDTLSKEKAELVAKQALLVSARDSLKAKNDDLGTRLDQLSRQLAEKIAALEQAERDRERLNQQADELEAIVAGLKQQLEQLNSDLSETRSSAATAQTESQTKVQELETQLAARDKAVDDYLAKLKRAAELTEGLAVEKKKLQQALNDSERLRQTELIEEGRNNRELIGLTGRLERVAILFDASGSMRQATAGGSDRWADSQAIAAKWLQHLNVRQCVLIVFSSTVRTFPDDGSLADLHGDGGQVKRELLLRHVKDVSPSGGTNTYDALRRAYEYDVDSILLFSDGAPSSSTSGVFDPAVANRIYALCREHPDIPIHTIGLGNYFDENASTFLMSLAKITNGTFRGQ